MVVMKDEGIREKNDGGNCVCVDNIYKSAHSISNGRFGHYS